jgi:hypothetical protein
MKQSGIEPSRPQDSRGGIARTLDLRGFRGTAGGTVTTDPVRQPQPRTAAQAGAVLAALHTVTRHPRPKTPNAEYLRLTLRVPQLGGCEQNIR